MTKRKSIFITVIAVFSIAILAILWIVEPDKEKMLDAFLNLKRSYLFGAVLVMALFVCVDGFNLWIMSRKIAHIKISLLYCLKVGLIGRTYNAVTPFGTGGQPYFIYALAQKGVKASVGASIIIVKYVIHQAVYILLALFAIIVTKSSMVLGSFIWICVVIGLIANITLPAIAVVASKNKRFLHKTIVIIGSFLSKIKIIKKTEDLEDTVREYVQSYHKGIRLLTRQPSLLVVIAFTTLFELVIFLMIPYMIRLGFGKPDFSLLSFICVYFLLYLAIAVSPTPGGAGVAEGGFYLIFNKLFPPASIISALLLWRGITYYLLLFCGGIAIMLDSVWKLITRKRGLK